MLAALALGCAPAETVESDTDGPAVVSGPELSRIPDVALSRHATVRTDVPTRLRVLLDGPDVGVEIAWPALATEHVVDLHGAKPDREISATFVLTDEAGRQTVAVRRYETDPLPDEFPDIRLLEVEPDAVEPGYRVLALNAKPKHHWLVALDPLDGEVAYLYTGEVAYGDVELTPRGTFVGIGLEQGVVELSTAGEVVGRWGPFADRRGGVLVPWIGNHELNEDAAGDFTTIVGRPLEVPSYPDEYVPPTPAGPAMLEDDGIVTFGRDGELRHLWWLSDVLDTEHIGFNGLGDGDEGTDWTHTNAVVRGLRDGSVIVSVRHQDLLFQADAETGAIDWMLGHADDWREPWRSRFLALPDGERAPLHAHGPTFDLEGNLVVFDNGNRGHTPYQPDPGGRSRSRLAAWRIDPEGRTADLAWEWTHPEDDLFSSAMGNVVGLSGGSVVACYGFLDSQGKGGVGKRYSRLIEVIPGRERPVSDIEITLDEDVAAGGVAIYRVLPTPSLYAAEVEVTLEASERGCGCDATRSSSLAWLAAALAVVRRVSPSGSPRPGREFRPSGASESS